MTRPTAEGEPVFDPALRPETDTPGEGWWAEVRELAGADRLPWPPEILETVDAAREATEGFKNLKETILLVTDEPGKEFAEALAQENLCWARRCLLEPSPEHREQSQAALERAAKLLAYVDGDRTHAGFVWDEWQQERQLLDHNLDQLEQRGFSPDAVTDLFLVDKDNPQAIGETRERYWNLNVLRHGQAAGRRRPAAQPDRQVQDQPEGFSQPSHQETAVRPSTEHSRVTSTRSDRVVKLSRLGKTVTLAPEHGRETSATDYTARRTEVPQTPEPTGTRLTREGAQSSDTTEPTSASTATEHTQPQDVVDRPPAFEPVPTDQRELIRYEREHFAEFDPDKLEQFLVYLDVRIQELVQKQQRQGENTRFPDTVAAVLGNGGEAPVFLAKALNRVLPPGERFDRFSSFVVKPFSEVVQRVYGIDITERHPRYFETFSRRGPSIK